MMIDFDDNENKVLFYEIMQVLKKKNGSKILASILEEELGSKKIKLRNPELNEIFIKEIYKETGIFKTKIQFEGEKFKNLELAPFFNISDITYNKLFSDQVDYLRKYDIPLRPAWMLSVRNLDLNGITIEGHFTECDISGTSFKGSKGAIIDLSSVTYDERTDFTDAEVNEFINVRNELKKYVKQYENKK